MPLVMALDQGTTSSRAILFDDDGQAVATAQREFHQYFPQPGWVEHDAEEIWSTQIAVAAEALRLAGAGPSDVAAVGVANQRETIVLWDRATGAPLHRAIVWQDRRTSDVCDRMREAGLEDEIQSLTGLVLDPYFSATKIAWLLDNVPGARALAADGKLACGTIDSWMAFKLSGGRCHVTDASNASRTLLADIHRVDWDEKLLGHFNVPRNVLPEIRPSSGVVCEIDSSLPLAGIPLASLIGDQQGALFGQACFKPGEAKNTYGTGCFLLMNTGTKATRSTQKLLTTIAWQVGGVTEYALEGSVFIGGAAVGWLRDGLGVIKSSADVEPLARSVPDSGGVIFVPAFAGLGAPHWDAYARGIVIGLTRGTSAAHLARAALDGVALQVADLLDAIQQDSGVRLTELRVDGGASANDLLLQIQADLLQTPVIRPKTTETTALGAAYLAGLAVGVWKDRSAVDRQWQIDRRFEPQIGADEAAARRVTWRRAVERAKGWATEV